MFLCVVFFVSFIAAIFGAWTINRTLSDAVIGLIVPVERIAGQAQQGLGDLGERLHVAQDEVTALRSEVDTLTVEIQENRELRVSLATTLTTRLEPIAQVAARDFGQVRDGLTAVNNTLEAVNRLPFVDISAPRLERLQEIEQNLATLTTQLTELKASGDRIGAAADEILPQVSQGLDALNETANTLQSRLDEMDAGLVGFTNRLASLKQTIAAGFTIITWAEIFLLAWLAASQVSLFSHAYKWAAKP
jgi:chromosome segregation ATPase